MLYEFRTYTLRPTTTPEVLKRFGDGYKHRSKYSELAAMFYTDIGPLNQIVHIWPYKDMAHRAEVRAASQADPNWPPPIHEFIVSMVSELFVPFPFSPELKAGKLGPVFEMRSYFVKPGGGLKATMERWEPALPARTALSPLAFVGHTDLGPLNKYVHIWGYASLDERARIRNQAVDTGVWPPKGGGDSLISQENKILLPAAFSPLQ